MINKTLTLLFLIIIACSCECVPDVSGPKTITPNSGTKVNLINSISDVEDISVYESDLLSVQKVNSGADQAYSTKFTTGVSSVSFKTQDKQTLYSGFIEFKENTPYTLIAYGNSSRAKALVTVDTGLTLNANQYYYRLFHISSKFGALKIKFSPSDSVLLSGIKTYTGFQSTSESNRSISLFEVATGNIIKNQTINLTQGRVNNIIIYDSPAGGSVKIQNVVGN